jgi:hypothetical protein
MNTKILLTSTMSLTLLMLIISCSPSTSPNVISTPSPFEEYFPGSVTATYTPVLLTTRSLPTVTSGIHVSPDGDDDNPGTFEKPFKTISRAASMVKAGDIVYVRSGTYVEQVELYRSGTEAAPIHFQAYPGEFPVIDGQGRLAANWGALLNLAGDYIELSGFEVKNSAGMCVKLAGFRYCGRFRSLVDSIQSWQFVGFCIISSTESTRGYHPQKLRS